MVRSALVASLFAVLFAGCGNPPTLCTPTSCSDLSFDCGQAEDGCGGVAECGVCGAGQNCGATGTANKCGAGTCTAKTCAGLGAQCGRVSDGCGALLECGSCASGRRAGSTRPRPLEVSCAYSR